eukprot:CAMPEP_0168509058 /NCGR_PEP_ID=MMETSP0405-20121227/526_1 /TAXON_ID=498012 /ORGANISM="Trichosphaerium sp, Strain Am-I-7 wt" /LENGTH=166 /DNA_ID=CAMNT_0008526397 /DNA_START=146 /DNA_END=646 /DNA_ORIENTATION=+
MEQIVAYIVTELNKKYPGHINNNQEWIFNNAGGAMGSMYVIHASLTEYLIIFGTTCGTEGHTGRFPFTDDYFMILKGEQWAHSAGKFEREVYKPGDCHHLKRGVSKQYKMPDTGCFALEYARGNILSMMPFGMADALFGTLDYWSFWQTARTYVSLTTKELLQCKV